MSDESTAEVGAPTPDANPASEQASFDFIDDLDAAIRFKTYLNGRAVDVPADTISDLASLESKYQTELRIFKEFQDERDRSPTAGRLYQKFVSSRWRSQP